jgi:putative transposase
MEAHELLERHTGTGVERRHDSRVAADKPDTRWCSDGFEIGCNNSEPAQSRTTVGGCGKSAMASRMTPR